MDSLARRKAALRARMKAARAAISPAERAEASGAAAERLFRVPEFAAARTILLFSSFGSELSIEPISQGLLGEGRRVLFPFLEGKQIRAAEVRSLASLIESDYGPREPADRVAVDASEIEVAVVPGLAFDRSGYRVGFGGGHYDRFLVHLSRRAVSIGMAFDRQLVETVPHGPEDVPVDLVVTDQETIDCRPRRSRSGSSGG